MQLNDDKIKRILLELQEQKEHLENLINEINEIKTNLDSLFPETLQARHLRFYEERIKTITSLFNLILDIRKEIVRIIKQEFDINSKIEHSGDIEKFLFENLDVRKIASRIESFKRDLADKNELIKEVVNP